ncbi:class II glutamine amidotransferase [Nocardia sp. NBC_01009]|uniref:class II glutamine amidotransferase n=1 Tax=Nocardia sp. NBC_01009 TaxID=2975996 RepID=UPI003866AAE1|nr:class II glutamine amidotransferase [Nocardia sp. NBC_01009]
MCLLTYLPPGTTPDPVALSIGATANPHGHGFAVIAGRRIITGHSMNAESAIDRFTTVRKRYPRWAALFHSRYATHGDRTVANCHPFRLGGEARTVLAHNGVLPKRVHPGPYDPRSDTRIAAEDYLPGAPFGSIDTHRGARRLAAWLGKSKLVILTVDPAYRYSAYLFGEKAGRWDGGIWYSNTSYLPISVRWPTQPRRYVCWYCGALKANRTSRHCGTCGWCFECEANFPDCDSAVSPSSDRISPPPPRAITPTAHH